MSKETSHPFLKWVLAFALLFATAEAGNGLDRFAPAMSEGTLLLLRATTVIAGGTLATWLASVTLIHRQDKAIRRSVWLLMTGTWLLVLSLPKLNEPRPLARLTQSSLTLGTVSPEDIVPANDVVLETDRGRRIAALCTTKSFQQSMEEWIRTRPDRLLGFTDCTLEQAPPDPKSNCYGWVFADGRYVINANELDKILSDNGYQRVLEPQSGDVIVYRSTVSNIPAHVGVVRFVDSVRVLIESKWGFGGQFLHFPQNQPFCRDFNYYRSLRQGHQLRVRKAIN